MLTSLLEAYRADDRRRPLCQPQQSYHQLLTPRACGHCSHGILDECINLPLQADEVIFLPIRQEHAAVWGPR